MDRGAVYPGETEARRKKSEAMVGVKNLEKVPGKWEEEAATLVNLGERSANGRQSIHSRKWGHALEEGDCLGKLCVCVEGALYGENG